MLFRRFSTVMAVGLIGIFLGTTALADTRSDYDHKYNLARVSTWDFYKQNRQQTARDQVGYNQMWDRDVRDDINSRLTADGFTKAAPGQQPDFQVAYYLNARQGLYAYPGWGGGWGWGWRPWGFWGYGGWGPAWGVPFTRSTLVVDVVDTKTNQLVWRGYDNRSIDYDKSQKTIAQSVDKLVARFAHDVKESRKKEGRAK